VSFQFIVNQLVAKMGLQLTEVSGERTQYMSPNTVPEEHLYGHLGVGGAEQIGNIGTNCTTPMINQPGSLANHHSDGGLLQQARHQVI